jgi:hypothetical protein
MQPLQMTRRVMWSALPGCVGLALAPLQAVSRVILAPATRGKEGCQGTPSIHFISG